MKYPISVVVPTKNRYKYLKRLVDLIVSFNTSEIELVIQDNSDDNCEFKSWLSKYNYEWIKYYFNDAKLTSIQNFDLAINHAKGETVCFIGDDDGVVRNIINCAKWMIENNIEAVLPSKSVYVWPNNSHKGFLTIEYATSIIEYLNPITELVKILNNGCQGLGNIPVTYTGIVSMKILNRIYNDYGTYFPGGASADIANGVALCFYVKRFVKVNSPLVITGTSAMTGSVSNRKAFIPFSEIPFISKEVGENWEGYFPKYWFGCFVWPESAIKSLRALGKESFISELDVYSVFSGAVIRAKVNPSEYKDFCSVPKLYVYVAMKFMIKLSKAANKRITWMLMYFFRNKKYRQTNVNDILNAEKRFAEFSIDFSKITYK